MNGHVRVLLAACLLASTSGGCMKWFKDWDGDLRACEADRKRMASELAETRTTRDQYRQELEKAKGTAFDIQSDARKAQDRITQANASAAAAQKDANDAKAAAQKDIEQARSEQAKIAGSLTTAESRNLAMQKQIADLNTQLTKLEADLKAANAARATAEQRAITAEQQSADAGKAKAEAASLQKQVDALTKDKQQLKQQLEDLKAGGNK